MSEERTFWVRAYSWIDKIYVKESYKDNFELNLRELLEILDYEILEVILERYIGNTYKLIWKHHFEIPRGVEAYCINTDCYLRKYNDSYLLKPFMYIQVIINKPFRIQVKRKFIDEVEVQNIIKEYERIYEHDENLRLFFTHVYRKLLSALEEYKEELRKIGIEA